MDIGGGGGGIATIKDTTHILMFCQTDDNEQEEGSLPLLVVVRAYGCHRDNNSSIQLLTCIDAMEHDESLSWTTRYYNAHLLLLTKLLKSCFGGCLFPHELVDWIAKSVSFIKRLFTFSFNENESINNTWLLSNDGDHWSFNMIKDKLVNHSDFRFDMLHVYWHFNYNEFLKLLKQCISEKRGPFRVSVNHEKLINCIDTTRSIVNTMYGERIDTGWFDSNFESHSSKQWCPIEFKGEHSPFFEDEWSN